MCCCIFRKGTFCLARWWHAIIYITIGLIILFCYLGLSITFYLECYSLNDQYDEYYPFQCGSKAMWACMGWVPLFFFFIITGLTFFYYFKQSTRTTKLITTSDAWLLLFVTVAACVLYFIHICYLAYISVKLSDNPGCDENNDLAPYMKAVDCTIAHDLIAALLFFAILLIIFICASLTILFALVNQRIATPVNYTTVTKDDSKSDDMKDPNEIAERARERMENLAAHKLGDRVTVRLNYNDKVGCNGTVRWCGQVKSTEYPTESTTSLPFLYGVHLDEKVGNCDGSIQGKERRPFKCPMGFGIFVPINHIKALPAEDDANSDFKIMRDMPPTYKNKTSINKALVITRFAQPNHLIQGNLFYYLRKLRFSGVVNYAKIGNISYSNKIESIKTKSMISVIFPQTNECIYNYLPLLSASSEYDEIFNPERNSQMNSQMNLKAQEEKIDEVKEKEEDRNMAMVNMWYLNLHESWHENSNKIKAYGVSDYQSSQWVRQSEQRAIDWYHMLGINKNEAIQQAKTRFEAAPLPMFLKHKLRGRSSHDQEDDMKQSIIQHDIPTATEGIYSSISSHYVPLGIFHNKSDITDENKVAFLEGPPIPRIFDQLNMKIELRLKRLIHEPVMNMQHILPFLHSKQYRLDSKDNNYGWFPIDWVYAEVDISDIELESKFSNAFICYTPPFDDDVDIDKNSYNPYCFMKYPRIPLFVLSLRLPLKELKQFAVQIVNLKYGQHSPSQQQLHERIDAHHPVINTSISIDNNVNPHIGSHKKRHKKRHKHYKNDKYEIPPQPKAKYKSYCNEPAVSVSVEMELTEVANAMAMDHSLNDQSFQRHHKKIHHKKGKGNNKRYEYVEQSDGSDEEDENDDSDSQYHSNNGNESNSDDEQTISDEESDNDSDEDEYESGTDSNESECETDSNEEEEEDASTDTTDSHQSHQHRKVIFKRDTNNRYRDSDRDMDRKRKKGSK